MSSDPTFDPTYNRTVVERLRAAVVDCNLNHVPQAVRRVIETEAWRERWDVNLHWTFDTFADFITTSPVNGGMGWKPELVEGLLLKAGDDDALVAWQDAMTPKHGGDRRSADAPIKSDNITLEPKRGTSRAYTLTRLKHEREDLYDQVKAKKMSANAAAIEAGWRKKPEPLNQLMNIACRLSVSERLAGIEYLTHLIRLEIGPQAASDQINCVVDDMLRGNPPTPALLQKIRQRQR
jgi:hypothetical protein